MTKDDVTRVVKKAKNTNFWLGLVSGGIGSLVMFMTMVFTTGQKLEAHTNEVTQVQEVAATNEIAIKVTEARLAAYTAGVNAKMATINTAIAIIETKQTSQENSLVKVEGAQEAMRKEQSAQTLMIQQILIEVKK